MKFPNSDGGGLNENQARAVGIGQGPALIIAGAGTGKTRVIVERISKLLNDGVPPARLLALTFTEKAAAEMLDRINEIRSAYQLELPVMTFNAFGESLLRRYAADIGLARNFTLLGDAAQIVFLRERLDELGLDYFSPVSRPDGMLKELADYFSLLKQNVITPEIHHQAVIKLPENDEAERLNKTKYLELDRAYERYLRLCREANVIDYDDQIYLVLELFRRRPNILKEVQAAYDWVMVDEFQDTNTMQAALVEALTAVSHNLFVVGDDDQSIYGWRGATLKNILEFKDNHPRAKEVTLTENYRSTTEILDAAYRLIQHNNPHRLEERLHINKRLHAQKAGQPPQVNRFENLEAEMHWIAGDIKRRIEAGASPAAIAILARRNATLKILQGYLELENIEHVLIGQRYQLYHEPTVRMLIEGLKATVDPLNNVSLYHTLTGPLFALPAHDLSRLSAAAKRSHETLAAAIEAEGTPEAQAALARIQEWREKTASLTVGQLAYEMIVSSGFSSRYYAYDGTNHDADKERGAARLNELFATMKQFEQIALQPSALQYLEALPALQAAGESGEDDTLDLSGSAVNLLSIHKAKGLEWPVVYIADCSEGSFPLKTSSRGIALPETLSAYANEADSPLAEERRLMYVAMTRARDELILTHAERHSSGSVRKPSRFLLEAFDAEDIRSIQSDARGEAPVLSRFADRPAFDSPLPATILQGTAVNLTVSQVQKYLDCPLDFYYCYILNVPQEISPELEYGTLMHSLLQTINQSLMAGKLVSYPELEMQLKQGWPRNGHMTAIQRDRARQQATKTLKAVYERAKTSGQIPLAAEESFSFSIPEANLTVSGRFDAVFPLGEGVEIVDYKTTTKVDNPEKAKRRATGSKQLTLYALAWQLTHDELPARVTLEFVDTGFSGSVRKTPKSLGTIREKLQQVAEGIRARQFMPGKKHDYCIHPTVDA